MLFIFYLVVITCTDPSPGLAARGSWGGGQETENRRQNRETACCQQRGHRNRGADDCSGSSTVFVYMFGFYLTFLFAVRQETIFREQVEGLVEDDDDDDDNEEETAPNDEEEPGAAVGAITVAEKKTERQRKREKTDKLKVPTHFDCIFKDATVLAQWFCSNSNRTHSVLLGLSVLFFFFYFRLVKTMDNSCKYRHKLSFYSEMYSF